MGNRGVLHDADGRIRRPWQLKRWIVCVLEFRGRWRAVMTPGRYTELFFLDEATALAAGHRPCAECRRDHYLAFRDAWPDAGLALRPSAEEIDARLHAERVGPDRTPRVFAANLDTLPNGVFVQQAGKPAQAFLVWDDGLFAWSPAGYDKRRPRRRGEEVLVLTPRCTVETMRAGYVPEVHASARVG
jgi:hypothetical protein